MLMDKYSRPLNYLRLSVTDRCNLRCFYCMPEKGVKFFNKENILSYEEMMKICTLLSSQGFSKIRLTGGEPFLRNDFDYFLKALSSLPEKPEITITTNATLIRPYIDLLKRINIRKINISFDSLDEKRFFDITRRNDFKIVYDNLLLLLREDFDVKLNCVVMEKKNTEDILPLAELTRKFSLNVRFLEEMPFNASNQLISQGHWDYKKILRHLEAGFGKLEIVPGENNTTSLQYRIPSAPGTIGIIPSFSRTFCGTCNRLRISATGDVRTCLYGNPAFNIKESLMLGLSDKLLLQQLQEAVLNKPKDGIIAEKERSIVAKESMTFLGG